MVNAGTVTPDLRAFPDDKTRFFTTVKHGQERQDAALGRHSERRSRSPISGPYLEPEESHEKLAGSTRLAALLDRALGNAGGAADDPLKICLDEDLPPLSAHHRGKPDSGFDVALAQAIAATARPAAQNPVVRKQARRGFEPGARSQCAALRRPLLAGRQLRPDHGLPGRARRQDRETAGFRGRHRADRPAPPRCRSACSTPSQPYVYSPLTVRASDREGARPPASPASATSPACASASKAERSADAILMTFDNGRLIDNITHLVPGRRRSARRARSRRSRCHAARPAPLRRLPRRPSRQQARRLRLLLSDRRQSRLCRACQRSRADRRRQQGADGSAGRGNHRRVRAGSRPHLSAAARAGRSSATSG